LNDEEEVDDEGEEEVIVVNDDDEVKCDPRLRLNYWSETSWLMMRKKLSWVTMTTK
jgi:predicted polyphosphate/ATP-dependent NAD kinase